MTRSARRETGRWRVWSRIAGVSLAACLAGACSLPIEVPLGALGAGNEPIAVTGSVTAEVVDGGVADRVGSNAWTALKAALVSAAERGEDGVPFAWASTGSGEERRMEGTVTAIDAFFDEDGAVCRRLAITAMAYQRQDAFAAEACRRDGGGWSVKPLTGEA